MQRRQIKKYISSPLNYIGGKARILDQILPLFPQNIDILFDMFCGGGNVGMNVNAKKVIYNDISEHLIGLFKTFMVMENETIINNINALIKEFGFSETRNYNFAYYGGDANLGVSKYNRKKFLKLRERFNNYSIKDNQYYILLYTLILFGFNNQIRFNEQGKFNLPVGKRDFNTTIHALYKQAYTSCNLLFVNCPIDSICPELKFNKNSILKGINKELGSELKDIEEAYSEVDKLRYQRFNKIINTKFSNKQLLKLLNHFDAREDDEINKMVTENADVPTIFEYIIGIIWYNISGRKGKILDYLKLSLDANLLPITHAAGGEADIVYQYNKTKDYPEHSLLIEATLADSTNQRRMEMEPVSRHLGNHLLQTNNKYSYCIFATSYLHINVIGDFRNRKTIVYCDPKNAERYVEGMKIIPLSTDDLRNIINSNIQYETLYEHFDKAYNAEEKRPKPWYDSYVHIPTNIERKS